VLNPIPHKPKTTNQTYKNSGMGFALMAEIPQALRSLFTEEIKYQDGSYRVKIPSREIETGSIQPGEKYRVAVLNSGSPSPAAERTRSKEPSPTAGPPVEEGERRTVSIDSIGDEGDGIAKVDRGYIVIVPEAKPGDKPTVEIDKVKKNVAFASVIDGNPQIR
jgi:predicted RNA-binding protein with TRAM domain